MNQLIKAPPRFIYVAVLSGRFVGGLCGRFVYRSFVWEGGDGEFYLGGEGANYLALWSFKDKHAKVDF